MAECARVAEVNAFIRLGGRPILWKGTVFRYCGDSRGNVVVDLRGNRHPIDPRDLCTAPLWVVVETHLGGWTAHLVEASECWDGVGLTHIIPGRFMKAAYRGRVFQVVKVPPDAPPVSEWSMLDG
jgi:hypothetical protein